MHDGELVELAYQQPMIGLVQPRYADIAALFRALSGWIRYSGCAGLLCNWQEYPGGWDAGTGRPRVSASRPCSRRARAAARWGASAGASPRRRSLAEALGAVNSLRLWSEAVLPANPTERQSDVKPVPFGRHAGSADTHFDAPWRHRLRHHSGWWQRLSILPD